MLTDETLAISLYSKRLKPKRLGQRAEIINQSLPLRNVFEAEIDEIGKRRREEDLAIQMVEKKRAEEIEIGRELIFLERDGVSKDGVSKGSVYKMPKNPASDFQTLPVCTRSPRMLVTGKTVAYKRSESC